MSSTIVLAQYQWNLSFESTTYGYPQVDGINSDKYGNIYAFAKYREQLKLYHTNSDLFDTLTFSSDGEASIIFKLDEVGRMLWLKQFGVDTTVMDLFLTDQGPTVFANVQTESGTKSSLTRAYDFDGSIIAQKPFNGMIIYDADFNGDQYVISGFYDQQVGIDGLKRNWMASKDNAYVLKLNESGEVGWFESFHYTKEAYFRTESQLKVSLSPEGDVSLINLIKFDSTDFYVGDSSITKGDSLNVLLYFKEGQLKWHKTFSVPWIDCLVCEHGLVEVFYPLANNLFFNSNNEVSFNIGFVGKELFINNQLFYPKNKLDPEGVAFLMNYDNTGLLNHSPFFPRLFHGYNLAVDQFDNSDYLCVLFNGSIELDGRQYGGVNKRDHLILLQHSSGQPFNPIFYPINSKFRRLYDIEVQDDHILMAALGASWKSGCQEYEDNQLTNGTASLAKIQFNYQRSQFNEQICQNDLITLPNDSTITWKNANMEIISMSDAQITFRPIEPGLAFISQRIEDYCQNTIEQNDYQYTVLKDPSKPQFDSYDLDTCAGEQFQVSASPEKDATYHWQVIDVSGMSTTVESQSNTFHYAVVEDESDIVKLVLHTENSCGISPPSDTVHIDLVPLLVPMTNVEGPGVICLEDFEQNRSDVLYTFNAVEQDDAKTIWSLYSQEAFHSSITTDNQFEIELDLYSYFNEQKVMIDSIVVKSFNSCHETSSFGLGLSYKDVPPIPEIAGIECKPEIIINNLSSNYDHSWFLYDEPIESDSDLLTISENGHYIVRFENECGYALSEELYKKIPDESYQIANAFTPNGDGINDTFELPEDLMGSQLTIVNRHGKIVFHSNEYQNDWDGDDLMSSTYFFDLQNDCIGKSVSGTITIVR